MARGGGIRINLVASGCLDLNCCDCEASVRTCVAVHTTFVGCCCCCCCCTILLLKLFFLFFKYGVVGVFQYCCSPSRPPPLVAHACFCCRYYVLLAGRDCADHPARQVHVLLLRQGHHQAPGDRDLEVQRLQEDLCGWRLHPQVSFIRVLICM